MCLMAAVTLGRGSVVHAMDPNFASFVATGETATECKVHQQASCDSDSHKATAHRHAACHGHKIGIPPAELPGVAASSPRLGYDDSLPALAADAGPNRMIRPPTA